jgi:uncharacterized membrane protein YjfL (UPF0719 family)
MKKTTTSLVLLSFLFISLITVGAGDAPSGSTTNTVTPATADANESSANVPVPDGEASGMPEELTWILYGGGYVLVSLVFLYLGKLIFDVVTPFKLDTQLTEKDNPAMGIVLTGFLLAVIIVICGVMTSDGETSEGGKAVVLTFSNFVMELVPVVMYTLVGMVFLLLSAVINDKLILREFSNTHEVAERKNCGVAVIIAAGFLGSGLVIAGAIQGSLDWISALVGFVVGQVLLVFFALIYQRATSYDDQKELHQRQNLAVGLAFAGNLLAYSLLLMKGLTMSGGELEIIQDRLWHFGYYAMAGAVALPCLRVVNDKLFLPGVNLADEVADDKNINAGLLEAGLAIAMAAILITCL